MGTVNVKLGDILNVNNFDPEKIDVSDLVSLSEKVPKDGVVDEATADQLAALFLHGADRASDLLAKAVKWAGMKYTIKNAARTDAMLIRATQAGHSSNAAQKDFACSDSEFIKASDAESTAEAWRTWLSNKREIFIKWHHLCKSIAERHHQGMFMGDPKAGAVYNNMNTPNKNSPLTLDYLDE
jgi:hypothetical protein